MKKRILSILLLCCMVLTMLPAPAFAADEEAYALPPDTGGLCEHHPEHDEACGYTPQTEDAAGTPCGHVCEICESGDGGSIPADPTGTSGAAMPMPLLGAVRPAATQYTYTLHYDANGGSGAPPSQSVKSTEFYVWVPISEKIPTRDGYTFMGWANTRTGKPIYGGNGGYTECLVVHGADMSTTIYAIWEAHDHSWGEWTSNGNGTHKRTCATDSSHTETGNCSGGKATSTEKAICETCHTAYGELLQLTKTVITTPPTLPAKGYVGNEYMDEALSGGEAKAEGTGVVVLGSFRFKHNGGGRVVRPGENRMEVLFTPDDTEAYTTAECIVTVTGIKRTITRVPEDVVITDKPLGTPFEDLGLPLSPYGVMVETNTGASFSPIPVTWDGSNYNPNIYGEQIITGELHVEQSRYTDKLEPTSTVKATARITLIDDRIFTPTLEPPTYSKQLYGGDLCFLVFFDKYLSGGTATANGETVSGKFTLDKDQKIYGHSLTASTLLQAGPLQLKVIFTPDNPWRYTKAECTIDVNVIPRTFKEATTGYITNKKFGTPFEELSLSDSFSFYAVGDENDPNGTGSNYDMPVVTSWDASTYDPNSFEEQTIYGTVDRAELEKYFTIPEGADLRAVRKVQLHPDPAETEITQPPVFRWRNGDFTLPDNTIFTWRKLQVKPYNDEVGTLVGGMAKVKGTDIVAPGTFSFKEAPPFYLRSAEEHEVTVVFKPDDTRLHKPTETTIKINAIKNTIKDIDEPDPITDKSIGTPFEQLGLPENVCINGVDGAWRWIEAAWNESSYDAQSSDWQTITGTLVLGEDDGRIFQQPEPAVTAAIRVKLTVPDSPPTVTTETLSGGTVGTVYSQRLTAQGTAPITWRIDSGTLPAGLSLDADTGEISGTPTAEQTSQFTVRALNSVGNDKKELSITITNAPAAEHTVTVSNDGNGTGAATPSTAAAGTTITLTATPKEGYHLKEWKVISGDVTIKDNKFLMPSANVEVKAIFEKDAPPAPTEFTITVKTDGNGTASASPDKAVAGTEIRLTATPDKGYHFKEWQVISGGVTIKDDKFTMPSANVEVKAIFEKDAPPAPTEFIVTFDGNGGMPSVGSMTTTNQKLTSLPSASRSGSYSFDGWYTEKSGGTKITTDTVFHAGTTVYAHWTYTGGGSSNYSYYTIKATAGAGGSISPSGNVSVRGGRDQAFTITPDKGYAVANVKIDGRSIGAVKSYTFENVKRAHTIEVSFTRANEFIDVPSDSYFYEAVMWAVENGVTTGASASRFNPNGICTRAQAVAFLWRTAGSPAPRSRIMPFTDVPAGSYYYDAVLWAAENGITKGTSDTTFSPNMTCTRAQIVAFLWRSEKSPAAGTANPFADVKSTDYYADAVLWAVREDITKGTTNTTFSPDADCTRAQIVTFLWRCKK